MYCKFLLASLLLSFSPLSVAKASTIPEDSNSAVVYAYFRVGDDDRAVPGILAADFKKQIDEIINVDAPYHPTPIGDILKAQNNNTSLPPKTIALTFEGSDSSFLRNAFPLLQKHKIPFTLFISAGLIDQAEQSGDTSVLTWDNLRQIATSGLATIGTTSYAYDHIDGKTTEELTADINRARERFRTELHQEPLYFSYPFGETTPEYLNVISKQGFVASFGQQSGAVGKLNPRNSLPRFTVIDNFADIERFKMTALTLPFPTTDIEPSTTLITTNPPHPGFTVGPGIPDADLKNMKCFASGIDKLDIQKIGARHFEIRFSNGFEDSKGRLNCTLPAPPLDGTDEPRWRWLGFLFSIPEGA